MEQANQNQPNQASWGIAFRIWWWITWRALLAAIAGGFIAGFIIGLAAALTGLGADAATIISALAGFPIGIVLNVLFVRKIIGKKFKDFTLVLLKSEQ